MEIPKFLKCPECEEKYNEKKKRRIIDSCGHPRCFSCLVLDNQCIVCETILKRRRGWKSSRDSPPLRKSYDRDESGLHRGSNHELFSKEQYLRMLYSYDPESKEHVRRGSFDFQTRSRAEKPTNLEQQYLRSAQVLPNEIQLSGVSSTARKTNGSLRSSLQEIIFSTKPEKERRNSLDNSDDIDETSQVISPRSSGYWSEVE